MSTAADIVCGSLPVLARNLLLTIAVELAAAALIGIRLGEEKNWQWIVLVNVMTNIPASLLFLLFARLVMPQLSAGSAFAGTVAYAAAQLILEAVIVIAEGKLFEGRLAGWPKKAIWASLAMNVSSYLAGVIIGVIQQP